MKFGKWLLLRKLLGSNWRTSSLGWIGGLGILLVQLGKALQGEWPDLEAIWVGFSLIFMGQSSADNRNLSEVCNKLNEIEHPEPPKE